MTDGLSARQLFFDLFRDLPRLAPGNDAITAERLGRIPGLGADSVVVDMGCGLGRSTLVLARDTAATVVAVDNHLDYLLRLRRSVEAAGVRQRVLAVQADMAQPPLAPGSADLVWAEGSIYIAGFGEGLRIWRRLLKPGGWVALTELTWLTGDAPERARRLWAAEYPGMSTLEKNLHAMEDAGFRPEAPVVLPASSWEEEYYRPLERRIDGFRRRHEGSPVAERVAAATQEEIDTFRESAGAYGYVFYVGQLTFDPPRTT